MKNLNDYIQAEESGEPIDPALREAVESAANIVGGALRVIAERMQPGTTAGDIWELVRPSATESEKLQAVERLADGPFKRGIIGKRGASFGRTEHAEILSSILVALHYEQNTTAREQVMDQTPRDALRVLRLRFEDELARSVTGKGRTKAERSEVELPDDSAPCFAQSSDVETQILIRQSLEHFGQSDPYLAAVIEALLLDSPLREITEKRGLSYASTRQAKTRHSDDLKKYFS